jgi:hypothetical protein
MLKKAHFGAFLWVSSWYAFGIMCCLSGPCFSRCLPGTQEVLSAWKESYLKNFDSSLVGCVTGDTLISIPGHANGNKHG